LNEGLFRGVAGRRGDAFFDFSFREQRGFFPLHAALPALLVFVLMAFLAAFGPMTHENAISLN
jgi:hypothetical protein